LTCHDLIVISLLLVACVIVVRWQQYLVRTLRDEIETNGDQNDPTK